MTYKHQELLTPTAPIEKCLRVYKRVGLYPGAWKRGTIQRCLLKWAEHKCEQCGKVGGLLNVHHIIWEARHDCTWRNLVVLCVPCHTRVHNHGWQPGKKWSLGPEPEWIKLRGLKGGNKGV